MGHTSSFGYWAFIYYLTDLFPHGILNNYLISYTRCLVQRERGDKHCASYCFGLFDMKLEGKLEYGNAAAK